MANQTARIVRFHSVGGPEVLKIEELPIPESGKGEVRLRVKAIGLNRAEVMFRRGQYLEQPVLPSKLGYEAAGVVEAVGPDVDKSWIGKKVSTIPAFLMTNYGAYGEVAIVPVSAIAVYPEKLTPEQGTAIWMQYLTAYGALIEHAHITKGDFVVITAASSSVGIAAIEMANVEGATSIATTRTAKKKGSVARGRAKHVVVAGEEDLVARINQITGGKGARVVFDPIAGKGIGRWNDLRIWRACDGADAIPVIYSPGEGAFGSRIHAPRIVSRCEAQSESSEIRIRSCGNRGLQAEERPSLPVVTDCGSASLLGIRRADRQDCRHGVERNSEITRVSLVALLLNPHVGGRRHSRHKEQNYAVDERMITNGAHAAAGEYHCRHTQCRKGAGDESQHRA
jgi:hypothetical protein